MKQNALSFIAPLSLEQFFEEYWEQQPLHIARAGTGDTQLVDFAAIESLLGSQAVYFPGVQLTHSGHVIDLASYADEQNRILPLRLLEHYDNGATIVLSQAQLLFSPLNELCREVIRTMKMRCQTNVYVSPPGNQGFNAHYDTHDVFILQISGAKTFNFYPSSVELPFPGEPFDSSRLSSDAVDESIALSAGDTLYIPRGVVHDAVADNSEPSIHVTLGVYPVLMRDMLQEAVQLVAESNPGLRKSIDTFHIASPDNTSTTFQDALVNMMNEVVSAVQSRAMPAQLQARFHDELSLGALQNCHGLSLRRGLPGSTKQHAQGCHSIRLRQEMVIGYECWSSGVKIRSYGQIVEFAEPISRAVSQLLVDGQLSLSTLDELSDDQRDAMIDRLLQENLIELY